VSEQVLITVLEQVSVVVSEHGSEPTLVEAWAGFGDSDRIGASVENGVAAGVRSGVGVGAGVGALVG
jgi:hypothetical protein